MNEAVNDWASQKVLDVIHRAAVQAAVVLAWLDEMDEL